MDNPSSYISFADYMGLNDEAGQAMLKRTMEQGGKLEGEVYDANEARDSLAPKGAEAFAGGHERVRKGLASYADFAKGLQDPVARQALMEKVYGRGAVSALDSSLAGASSGATESFAAGNASVKEAGRYSALRAQRGGQNAANADQYKAQDEAYDAELKAKRDAHKQMLLKRDVDDENARVDDWVRHSGDAESAFGQGFDARNYDPNAMVSGGSSSGWDLFQNPLGNKMNAPIKARDAAASTLKGWESGKNSFAARKWVKGASTGGGGYNDSAAVAERKRRNQG